MELSRPSRSVHVFCMRGPCPSPVSWETISPAHPTAGLMLISIHIPLLENSLTACITHLMLVGKRVDPFNTLPLQVCFFFLNAREITNLQVPSTFYWTVVKRRLNSFFSRVIFGWQEKKKSSPMRIISNIRVESRWECFI